MNESLGGKQVRLANIRTLLAFLRTAIAFWGLGIALFHFINQHPYKILGLIALVIGFFLVAWGLVEFFLVSKYAEKQDKQYN